MSKVYNYLTQNSKIKAMSGIKTYNFGIPAFRARDGFVTCPSAGICAKGCYAKQGAYAWSNVQDAYEKRLALTKSTHFVSTIDAEIKRRGIKRVRIHDSGDFYSLEYFKAWLDIITRNPNTIFYAYTKRVTMIRSYKALKTLPNNFTYIFSEGGREDKFISDYRHSRVFNTLDELTQAGYANASKDDSMALGVNKKIGLIYHGAKSKNWATNTKGVK